MSEDLVTTFVVVSAGSAVLSLNRTYARLTFDDEVTWKKIGELYLLNGEEIQKEAANETLAAWRKSGAEISLTDAGIK